MDSVTVVQSNALILETLQGDIGRYGGNIYRYPSVKPVIEAPRSFIEHSADRYDVVLISLSDTFHPITSGAYSLSENYLYTTEALAGAWRHLRPGGLLAVPRWLQLPPSESLRIMATALEALERAGVAHPASHVAMIRSWSTSLLLMGREPLAPTDLARIREFCQARQFDLVYYPGMARQETNRYNVLPEPYDYDAIQALLASSDRSSFYAAYPFDVRPATDNRPFFFHFFKWSQTPELLQNVGKVWQPFGGGGYFVMVALLLLALLASALFILVPLWVLPRAASVRQRAWRVFAFFGLLGLAYLFVEIPLLPKLVLFLGQPTYSFAAVLFALLLFSGVGSAISSRFSLRWVLPILGCLVLPYGWGLSWLLSHFMGYAIGWRVLLAVLSLAPLGLLMGMPFPRGIALVAKLHPDLISWVWAINACASVVSSTLAMILALSFGLNGVILAAGLCYLGCWLTILPLL
jgi:hypothetical protein